MRRVLILLVAFAAGIGIAALVGRSVGIGPFDDSDDAVPLRVMTFNVFYGGDDYDLKTGDFCAVTNGCGETLDKVVAAIRSARPDVVGLEEGEGNTEVIAKRLGWHASPRTQIISRYPLIDPPGADGAYVLVEVEPGKVVAMSSVHLPATPYGPYEIRDGASAAAVKALEEKTRVPMLAERLQALEPVVEEGMPVFLVGDFNSPSQLDWTAATADARKEVPWAFAWPAGERAAAAGFRDSYREAHPDPVATPGFTWTPGGPEGDPKEVHDRIDWVLVAGPAETESSEILGEKGNPDVTFVADPFPSDHRGVVSTFAVEPGETPTLVAVEARRVTVGDGVPAIFSDPDGKAEQVVVVPAGASGEPAGAQATGGAERGTVTLPTSGLEPGPKEAVLLGKDGTELSRSPFWLYPPDERVTVTVERPTVTKGRPIVVTWRNAPGNRWDWLGIFEATDAAVPVDGTVPDDSGDYLLYEYTHTAIEGSTSFSKTSEVGSGSWPLPPGRYEVRLMLDDGYRTVARSQPFTITG